MPTLTPRRSDEPDEPARRNIALVLLACIVVLAALGSIRTSSRAANLPPGDPYLVYIVISPLATADQSQVVNVTAADLASYPLLEFALDAVANPAGYGNVTRDGTTVVITIGENQREVLWSYLNSRREVDHPGVPVPEAKVVQAAYCDSLPSGDFCGSVAMDFRVTP